MSSRLFQNVREKRGLAYAVFSGLSAYRDAGAVTIYAGCANEAVGELIDVVVGRDPPAEGRADDGRRAAARQGSSQGQPDARLESTSSRMSNLARQEMYFDRQLTSTRRCRASRR
jgi:predicted Zn-dependent peptidase